jgi:hypothetical protein
LSSIVGANKEELLDCSLDSDTAEPVASHRQNYHINVVSSNPRPSGIRTHNDHIGGAMVSVLASSAVDREFEPRSGQTKDYKIAICCFSAKHEALRRKSKDWLVRNQNNVSDSEWSTSFHQRLPNMVQRLFADVIH